VVFQDKITSFFPDFSRHFVNKTLQNWLLNAEICYAMYSSIPTTEMASIFLTLNFRCFGRKLTVTNSWVINSDIDICLFQVSITVFKDFSRLFHTYDHFQDFSRP